MWFSPILILHISAGILGMMSGTAAISFRKGSPRHALAGRVFVTSMLTMAAAAVYLAIVKTSAKQPWRRHSDLLPDSDRMADRPPQGWRNEQIRLVCASDSPGDRSSRLEQWCRCVLQRDGI